MSQGGTQERSPPDELQQITPNEPGDKYREGKRPDGYQQTFGRWQTGTQQTAQKRYHPSNESEMQPEQQSDNLPPTHACLYLVQQILKIA
ncbi:hypothetical protein RmaAA213_04580 [Rhodothermus marinus]|nr:hypothetical protein RmaAA213_04580 [Rhodothermus marinus]BBM71577.1 hypothetical protein RmaAA338_04420 [Rhodothermus marinus]